MNVCACIFSPVNTVTARPVQIRGHHHIEVFTDINEESM